MIQSLLISRAASAGSAPWESPPAHSPDSAEARALRPRSASEQLGRGPQTAPSPWVERLLGVGKLALGGLEHAGAVLVLSLVTANGLDPGLVAFGEHGTDFLDT